MRINSISTTLTGAGGKATSTVPADAPAKTVAPAPASPAPPAVAANLASATASLIASTYSVTVAGKSYSGTVSLSNGLYQISVAKVPGASVTAANLQEAKVALTVKIDTLV